MIVVIVVIVSIALNEAHVDSESGDMRFDFFRRNFVSRYPCPPEGTARTSVDKVVHNLANGVRFQDLQHTMSQLWHGDWTLIDTMGEEGFLSRVLSSLVHCGGDGRQGAHIARILLDRRRWGTSVYEAV